jgi:hypothetical protein
MVTIWDDVIIRTTQSSANQLLAELKQILTRLAAGPREIIKSVEVDHGSYFGDDPGRSWNL